MSDLLTKPNNAADAANEARLQKAISILTRRVRSALSDPGYQGTVKVEVIIKNGQAVFGRSADENTFK